VTNRKSHWQSWPGRQRRGSPRARLLSMITWVNFGGNSTNGVMQKAFTCPPRDHPSSVGDTRNPIRMPRNVKRGWWPNPRGATCRPPDAVAAFRFASHVRSDGFRTHLPEPCGSRRGRGTSIRVDASPPRISSGRTNVLAGPL